LSFFKFLFSSFLEQVSSFQVSSFQVSSFQVSFFKFSFLFSSFLELFQAQTVVFKFPTFFQTQQGMAGSLPTKIARSVNCSCVEGFGKAEEFLFEKSNSKRCSVSTRSKTSIKHEISSQKLDNSFRYQSEQCMERATPKGRVQPVVKITSDGRILRKRKERVT